MINANNANDITYQYSGDTQPYTEDTAYVQADPFVTLVSPYKGLPFPGSNGRISLASRNVTFTPNTLGNTVHVYTSPDISDIQALSAYFSDWGASWSVQEGPLFTITVSAPWDTISESDWYISLFASEQWELIPNQGNKSILHSGMLQSAYSPPWEGYTYSVLPDVLKVAVKRAKDNNTEINISGSNLSPTYMGLLAPWMPYAQKTLAYMRMGVESIPSYSQTLKRTAVIDKNNKNNAFQTEADSARYSLSEQGSINYLLSTKDLIEGFNVPAETVGKFLLPSYRKRLSVTNVQTTEVFAAAGWLIKPPSFQFIGKNKIQLTQEFIWDEWLENLYYIYSDPEDFPLVN